VIWLQITNIFSLWWSHFSQLFGVHGFSDLRQTEIHTAQPIVPELSAFEVEMAIEEVKIHITRY